MLILDQTYRKNGFEVKFRRGWKRKHSEVSDEPGGDWVPAATRWRASCSDSDVFDDLGNDKEILSRVKQSTE